MWYTLGRLGKITPICRSGGIGRRARLKIVFPPGMRVRFPPSALAVARIILYRYYSENILPAGGCFVSGHEPVKLTHILSEPIKSFNGDNFAARLQIFRRK